MYQKFFQFSLWDSKFWKFSILKNINSLSILFMRFLYFYIVIWGLVLNFQFSLWDSHKLAQYFINKYFNFQFSLWDSYPMGRPSVLPQTFQFSLWDSQGIPLVGFELLTTFNSLYEILKYTLIPYFTISNFQFSLWDSNCYNNAKSNRVTELSILFMRFNLSPSTSSITNSCFQFSLWDSTEFAFYLARRGRESFNSLYEIRQSGYPSNCATQYSLSILFMRFFLLA